MASFLRGSFLLAATAAIGCGAPAVDDMADAAGSVTEGIVLVERLASGDGAAQTSISAKFMRLSAPADPALAERVVGTRLDLPSVGTCRPIAGAGPGYDGAEGITRAPTGSIELIDVGDVTLRAGPDAMPLAARAFPDVGELVSGVFYTSRDAASDLPAGATYTLEGTGSAFVDRFSVEADAPPALADVSVDDAALTEGVTLDEDTAATVRWSAAPVDVARQAARQGDVVFVDVSAQSGAQIRCVFQDEGRGVLPAWVMRPAMLGALPATVTLAVHRVRERSFLASGLDAGEVRFDLAVLGRATVTQSVAVRGSGAPQTPPL
jgi:hypothetical protein